MSPPSTVDLILCGGEPPPRVTAHSNVPRGGAAACVIAGRLAAASPDLEILVIEAGADNFGDATVVKPGLYTSHQAPGARRLKRYKSRPVEGREDVIGMGRGLGGGSSVNFMFYNRAAASDYDDWGGEGWRAQDLKPLLRKLETYHKPTQNPETHGNSGPIHISDGNWPNSIASRHAREAAESLGYPVVDDANDLQTSNAYMENWPKYISPVTGRRQDAAHAYVHPLRDGSRNLHILCDHTVSRVVMDNGTAVGVEYVSSSPPDGAPVPVLVRARKLVVVAAGALESPAILERSGVGDPEVLRRAGVECRIDLPGVGATYLDHCGIFTQYRVSADVETHDEYIRGNPEVLAKAELDFQQGKGMHSTNFCNFGGKLRPTAEEAEALGPEFKRFWDETLRDSPDKPAVADAHGHAYMGDPALITPNPHGGRYITSIGYLMYPLSRGTVHISGSSPHDEVDLHVGYLADVADVKLLSWTYKKSRDLIRRMKCFRGEEPATHPQWAENSKARLRYNPGEPITEIVYSAEDDALIERFLKAGVKGTWHSMGTCPMKPKDAGGVVDERLNVHGVQQLKVADLSISPSNVGANTYNTALLVGEKAACLIAEDLGISLSDQMGGIFSQR